MCKQLKHLGPLLISIAGPGKLMIFFRIKFAIFSLACMAHSKVKKNNISILRNSGAEKSLLSSVLSNNYERFPVSDVM